MVGVDCSTVALAAAARSDPDGEWVRADFRELPFDDGEFDGAYAWYGSLFYGPEHEHSELLEEIHRVLCEGGRLLHDAPNPHRLEADPVAEFDRTLDDGRRIQERCEWRAGREHGWRRLTRADGTELLGGWSLRHYDEVAIEALLHACGFEVESICNEAGRPFEPDRSVDLVAVARRR